MEEATQAHLFSTTFNLGSADIVPIFLPNECTCEREKRIPHLSIVKRR
jgi:hypothetical protein